MSSLGGKGQVSLWGLLYKGTNPIIQDPAIKI